MSKPTTDFNVNFNNNYGRPCLIIRPIKEDPEHKEKAMFHEWFVTEDVVSPRFNTSKNPLPWGQRSSVVGLVELENGRMTLVTPHMITFTDSKVSKLFEETHRVYDLSDWGYPDDVEGFIKSCSFDFMDNNWYAGGSRGRILKCITLNRFIEALEEYFLYKWDNTKFHLSPENSAKTIEEFACNACLFDPKESACLSNDCQISNLMVGNALISHTAIKESLKRYFNYEWKDEIYDKY